MRLSRIAFLFAGIVLVSYGVFAQTAEPSAADCSDWKATHSVKRATYVITATCQMPTPAHIVELIPAETQGRDPSVYVLNEVVHAPDAMVTQVITPFRLSYQKRSRATYKEFVINPGNIHVAVAEPPKPKTEPAPAAPMGNHPENK
jgi:hypothetical protein